MPQCKRRSCLVRGLRIDPTGVLTLSKIPSRTISGRFRSAVFGSAAGARDRMFVG